MRTETTHPVATPSGRELPVARWTKGRLLESVLQWLPSMAIIVAVLAGWEAYVKIFDVESWFIPAPSAVAVTLWTDADILARNSWVTLIEVLFGFGLALAAASVLATIMALSRIAERAVYPFVIAAPTIPWLVVAPLFLIWFGAGMTPKVVITGLIAFFPIVVNAVDGLRSVDPDLVNLAKTLGATKRQLLVKIQIPSALPYLFTGIKIAAAVSVIGAVVGEWMGSSEGLGHLMLTSKSKFLTERVFASIAILSAMGIGLFALVGLAEKLMLPWWHGEQQRTD